MATPNLAIILLYLVYVNLSIGEHDFNFNEDSQFCCSGEPNSTETFKNNQLEKGFVYGALKYNFKKRLPRYKREQEGSGEEDYDQYDYEDEITDPVTDTPLLTTHAHRHHHGVAKVPEFLTEEKTKEIKPENNNENLKAKESETFKIDEDIISSVSKLESDITKTIENTKTEKHIPLDLNIEKTQNESLILNTTENETIKKDKDKQQETETDSSKTKNIDDERFVTQHFENEIGSKKPDLPTSEAPTQKTILEKELNNNTSAHSNKSIPIGTDQQEEFEINVLIPTTTEEYSTSEQELYIYATNKTQTAPTNRETSSSMPTTENEKTNLNNTPPLIKSRLKKYTCVSGKVFRHEVPLKTFYDNEDGYNLKLELLDKNEHLLKSTSWIQFDAEKKEIYGLPMEDTVSKWQFKLKATDSGNESVIEIVEVFVYQHKGLRSVNHEINVQLELLVADMKNVDWQIMLIQGIVSVLDNKNTSNVVVREIVQNQKHPYFFNFTYFNESLPTGSCPEEDLNRLVKILDTKKFSNSFFPKLQIKNISGRLIGPCQKQQITSVAKNYPPVPRNQVDRVNATVGHLMIYKVPEDTFYDPNDNTNLKLSLLTIDRKEISHKHWLRFDSKNKEFYGIPKSTDVGSEEFLLVAEDTAGLTATDALIVVVSHAVKREYSVYFKAYLAIRHEQFNAILQRKFVERLSNLFGDNKNDFIQIRSITTHLDSDGTIVNFYNTTLYKTQHFCPEERIEWVRNVYFVQDFILRDRVKRFMGTEINVTNIQIIPLGSCHQIPDIVHRDTATTKNMQPDSFSIFTDDYVFSFVIPAIIMLTMILLVAITACFLHRRRITGKMELGDEEERKSFRPKGIPVIFQDELDEKPEIGNKSPIILKDEKPPLLPPSYNQSNFEGEHEVDEYVPPPAVVVGSREIRGKSPATPSYRKPPPYVSP